MNKMHVRTGGAGQDTGRRAFTLIELLVVVGIIMILVGITIAAMNVVARKTATAQTLKVLQQVKTGLGMFYGSYGAYPPSDQCPGGTDDTTYNRMVNNNWRSIYDTVKDWHEQTGLVYYLSIDGPDVNRWASYMEGLPNGGYDNTSNWVSYVGGSSGQGGLVCSNRIDYYVDGWGNKLLYQSTAVDDHQGYKLWSCGENGANENGGGDDIGVSSRD